MSLPRASAGPSDLCNPSVRITSGRDGPIFEVRVTPGASRTELAGAAGGVLRVRLTAPPVDQAANEALIALLARGLGLPRQRLRLLSGAASRTKRILAAGITAQDLASRFVPLLTRR